MQDLLEKEARKKGFTYKNGVLTKIEQEEEKYEEDDQENIS